MRVFTYFDLQVMRPLLRSYMEPLPNLIAGKDPDVVHPKFSGDTGGYYMSSFGNLTLKVAFGRASKTIP